MPTHSDSHTLESPSSPLSPSVTPPIPQPKLTLCPYCGNESLSTQQCEHCRGLFDPLSRQASQNAMGPWFLRDESGPFRPGFSYETLRAMIVRNRLTRASVLRGPTTRQFWTRASATQGVAHLLGLCHACQNPAAPADARCGHCGAGFEHEVDRQFLGLGAVHLLPGQATPEQVAASSLDAARLGKTGRSAPAKSPPPQSGESFAVPGPVIATTHAHAGDAAEERGGDLGLGQASYTLQRRERRRGTGGALIVSLVIACVLLLAALVALLFGPEEWAAGLRTTIGPTPTSSPGS